MLHNVNKMFHFRFGNNIGKLQDIAPNCVKLRHFTKSVVLFERIHCFTIRVKKYPKRGSSLLMCLTKSRVIMISYESGMSEDIF
jgi:hypothetical protein